jgi:hypothetical protein
MRENNYYIQMRIGIIGLAAIIPLIACSPEATELTEANTASTKAGKTDDYQNPSAMLSFEKDWQVNQSGMIHAGAPLTIKYDVSRLAGIARSAGYADSIYKCNGGYYSGCCQAKYNYELNVRYHDGEAYLQKTLTSEPLTLDVPVDARRVELFFRVEARIFNFECNSIPGSFQVGNPSFYDSQYGQNYTYDVVDAPVNSIINFPSPGPDGYTIPAPSVEGTLKAGQQVTVKYILGRIEGNAEQQRFFINYHCYGYGCCEHQYQTTMRVRFTDSGTFDSYPMNGSSVELGIPEDAKRIEIYFDSEIKTKIWYCGDSEAHEKAPWQGPDTFYDSDNGKNFIFAL